MNTLVVIVAVLLLAAIGYVSGRSKVLAQVGGRSNQLHSLPSYYGYYVAICCGIPALLIVGLWLALEPTIVEHLVVAALPEVDRTLPADRLNLFLNDIRNLATGNVVSREVSPELQAAADHYSNLRLIGLLAMALLAVAVAIAGTVYARARIEPQFRARNRVEKAVTWFLVVCSTVAILTTIGIVMSLLFESFRFFNRVPFLDFLFGLRWSPQTAMRADQVASSGEFGAVPLFVGTMLISFIAMLVAVPIGLLSAIYMAEYAAPKVRSVVKPALEILAGIPTVVYGFFAALTVAPFVRDVFGPAVSGFGESIGLPMDVSSESALAAGVVMGVMIIPFVSSLSDDVISAVPQSLREGSYGMGATKSETIKRVVFPAALPGIIGGILLAVSRAIGETMIVVMAAGLAANLTANPFEAVTTVTVQIVTLLVGDQEFDSAKTLAAFALGLVLFFVTLGLNIIALHVVRKYREQYE